MFRKFGLYGITIFLFLFVQTINAAAVPISLTYKNDKEIDNRTCSGIVVGNIGPDSIVTTAGHLFQGVKKENIEALIVFGKIAELVYTHCEVENETKPGCEDLAILRVKDINWVPLWKLEDGIPQEHTKNSGFIEGFLVSYSGVISTTPGLLIDSVVWPGQSGGPILVLRNGKYICVGSSVAAIMISNKDNQVSFPLGFSIYCESKIIRKRLDEHVKGWNN